MKKILTLLMIICFLFSLKSYSQMGIGTTSPNSTAVLQLYSKSLGFLVPRMNSTQRDSINNPAYGLLIFNLYQGNFEYFDSIQSTWRKILTYKTGWNIYGNSGTNSYVDFIGTYDNTSLIIRTNNIERMRFDSTGSIGLGSTNPKSIFDINGSFGISIITVTGNYTALKSDHTILCNTGNMTLSLPPANSCKNRIYVIKKISPANGTITINPNSNERIDGALTNTRINNQWESVMIQSNGSNWYILGVL